MVDLTKHPAPEPDPNTPPQVYPYPTDNSLGRAKPWVWAFLQILFALATVAHVGYDAFDKVYSGERISGGLGLMTMIVVGINVDRFLGRGTR